LNCNIWFVKPEYEEVFKFGAAGLTPEVRHILRASMLRTHVLVRTIEASCPKDARQKMQGQVKLVPLCIAHISIDVGDIIEIGDECYMVEVNGFALLEGEWHEGI